MRQGTLGSNLIFDKGISRISGGPTANITTGVIIPDISFYQESANFAKMKANGAAGVIIRAGQKDWPDTKFDTFWRDAKAAGLPRGTYFFFDSRATPESQADLFYSRFANDPPEMEVMVDYEESYGGSYKGWVNLYLFIERLRERGVPLSKIAIYTGYYYWRANSPVGNSESLNYFGQYPLWLAWYTSSPANVSIPAPWTSLLFWQFTSSGNGPAYGVGSNGIDLNYFNGNLSQFNERYKGGVVVPPEPPPAPPPTGDTMIFVIPKSAILDAFVTGSRTRKTVGAVAADLYPNFNFGINGDGWSGTNSNSIWYSEGKIMNGVQMENRPWINFDKSNNFSFGWKDRAWRDNFNALSGTRFIVENGAKNSHWQEWSKEKNARTAIGIAGDNLVVAIIDGWDIFKPNLDAHPPKGLSLAELADLMIANGCQTAIDLDGGGSTTLAINGQVANDPNDDGIFEQSAVINHLFLKLSEIPGDVPAPPPVEPPPVEPPAVSIPPVIETKELDGTLIARYERVA